MEFADKIPRCKECIVLLMYIFSEKEPMAREPQILFINSLLKNPVAPR